MIPQHGPLVTALDTLDDDDLVKALAEIESQAVSRGRFCFWLGVFAGATFGGSAVAVLFTVIR